MFRHVVRNTYPTRVDEPKVRGSLERLIRPVRAFGAECKAFAAGPFSCAQAQAQALGPRCASPGAGARTPVVLYWFMLRSFLLGLLLFAFAASLPAEEVSREDALAIRAVIAEQLDAFAHDDARRAFSLATTGIRLQFGTPEVFMNMVRTDYPVVYRPKTVQFEGPVIVDGELIQPVKMTDAEGRAWIALYPMQREPDGGWRISGCQLARLPGRVV